LGTVQPGMLAFPPELLDPTDPRVRSTLAHVRRDYAEGVVKYRKFLHR
jgi:hypothetical protein